MRGHKGFTMLSILALAAAGPTIPTDFRAVMTAARRDHVARKTDQFAAATVDQSFMGKPFRVAVPVDPLYYPENNRLVFTVRTRSNMPLGMYRKPDGSTGFFERVHYIEVARTERAGGSYIGQNAFGVTKQVTVKHQTHDGVAIVGEAPEDGGREALGVPTYDYETTLPGPQAKALAADTQMVLEGTYAPLEGGNLTSCFNDGSGPTINSPTLVTSLNCYAGAHISRVAFVRVSTGEVLKEWTNTLPEASGPVLWSGIRYGMSRRQYNATQPDQRGVYQWGGAFKVKKGDETATVWLDIKTGTVQGIDLDVPGQPTAFIQDANARYGSPIETRCREPNERLGVCHYTWVSPEKVRVAFDRYMDSYTVKYTLNGETR